MIPLYVVSAVGLAAIGLILYVAISSRRAGAAAERAKVATATVDVLKAQDKAGAEAPHDKAGVVDALDKGEF